MVARRDGKIHRANPSTERYQEECRQKQKDNSWEEELGYLGFIYEGIHRPEDLGINWTSVLRELTMHLLERQLRPKLLWCGYHGTSTTYTAATLRLV
jgi:hypothetical protein